MNDYEKLKELIQFANPEQLLRCNEAGCMAAPCNYSDHRREIRLADVLLAIENRLKGYSKNVIEFWNPKDDNLDHQSEECKQFLIELLT